MITIRRHTVVGTTPTILVFTILALLSLCGCSTTANTSAIAPTADEIEAPPVFVVDNPPMPPEVVLAAIERLKGHQRTLYSLSRSEYNFYMGGLMNAVYREDSSQLSLIPDGNPTDRTACSFSAEGRLLTDHQERSRVEQQVAACNRMFNTLNRFLIAR